MIFQLWCDPARRSAYTTVAEPFSSETVSLSLKSEPITRKTCPSGQWYACRPTADVLIPSRCAENNVSVIRGMTVLLPQYGHKVGLGIINDPFSRS